MRSLILVTIKPQPIHQAQGFPSPLRNRITSSGRTGLEGQRACRKPFCSSGRPEPAAGPGGPALVVGCYSHVFIRWRKQKQERPPPYNREFVRWSTVERDRSLRLNVGGWGRMTADDALDKQVHPPAILQEVHALHAHSTGPYSTALRHKNLVNSQARSIAFSQGRALKSTSSSAQAHFMVKL